MHTAECGMHLSNFSVVLNSTPMAKLGSAKTTTARLLTYALTAPNRCVRVRLYV